MAAIDAEIGIERENRASEVQLHKPDEAGIGQ